MRCCCVETGGLHAAATRSVASVAPAAVENAAAVSWVLHAPPAAGSELKTAEAELLLLMMMLCCAGTVGSAGGTL